MLVTAGRAFKTHGIGRNGADDEDDPPYVTGVHSVGDVETAG